MAITSASIKPREGPLENDLGEGLARAKHAGQFVAAIQSDTAEESLNGLAPIGRVGANRRDKHRMRLAKAAFLVKGP